MKIRNWEDYNYDKDQIYNQKMKIQNYRKRSFNK